MSHLGEDTDFDASALPPVIRSYLNKQLDRSQRPSMVELFASDARVVDEGIEYSGIDAIRGWLGTVASQYTYTTTFTGQRHGESDRWEVLARLEGNFPGGVADLRFRFVIDDGRIADLVIAP